MLTPKGRREVEALRVGDEVTVIDPATRTLDVGKVSAIRTRPRECARLWTRLGPLTLTTDHPLFDPSRAEWAPAGDWVLGLRSAVLLVDGEVVEPGVVVRAERFVGLEDVFDLTVDHPHHDFVAEGVLVHNKPPIMQPCLWPDGGALFEGTPSCACPDGSAGVPVCNGARAVCLQCVPPATAPLFASTWSNDAGVTDHARWLEACGPSDALRVVPAAPLDFARTPEVLRLSQPGDGGCALLHRPGLIEATRSHFGRVFFRGDADGGLQRVVRLGPTEAPWLTVLGREDVDGGQRLVLEGPGDGGVWRSPPVPRRAWLLYEWHFSVTDGRFQVWPRLFDAAQSRTLDAQAWTRDDGARLDAWYGDGHFFSLPDAGLLDLSLGVEPADATGDLFCADVAVSTSDWLGTR